MFSLPVGWVRPTLELGLSYLPNKEDDLFIAPVSVGMRYLYDISDRFFLWGGAAFQVSFPFGHEELDKIVPGGMFSGGLEFRGFNMVIGLDAGYNLNPDPYSSTFVGLRLGYAATREGCTAERCRGRPRS